MGAIIKAFGGKTVTRAPRGGFDHPVNGRSYKGGQFCPLFALSGGSEETEKPGRTLPALVDLMGHDFAVQAIEENTVKLVGPDKYNQSYRATRCGDGKWIITRVGPGYAPARGSQFELAIITAATEALAVPRPVVAVKPARQTLPPINREAAAEAAWEAGDEQGWARLSKGNLDHLEAADDARIARYGKLHCSCGQVYRVVDGIAIDHTCPAPKDLYSLLAD